ncbi:MAG: hypothetical protein WC911_01320 [Thermoleophilia bacterium]
MKTGKLKNPLIRNIRGMDRLQLWLLAAIVTILSVRLFLKITGYPQMGGSSLHVAHVLWGGLLMGVGIIILFTFLGSMLEAIGTLVGGVGFGLFMDEVGKFVTQDNDYFFQPSVAIMYTVFIVLYMTARWVLTSAHYSETEYLVNSINEMRELPIGKYTEEEKKLILYGLGKSDAGDPLVVELTRIIHGLHADEAGRKGIYVGLRNRLIAKYQQISRKGWFTAAIILFFLLQFIGSIVIFVTLMLDSGIILSQLDAFGFTDWAILASDTFSAVFITLGVLLLRRSRLAAFRMFERSVLIQIFVGQMFLFEKDEFTAIPGFVFYLLLLLAIRFIVQRERSDIIARETSEA